MDLFPPQFENDSVKDQAGLETAFEHYPNYAKSFVHIAIANKQLRLWFEEWWPKVAEFLDPNFITEFHKEDSHRQRAWEFHLAVVFLKNGLRLIKTKGKGPDFCILTDSGRKVWIEAISCDLGIVDPVEPMPDLKAGVIYTSGGNIEDINRPRALRITNAIATKLAIIHNYLNDPQLDIAKEDPVIIAVNGERIQHQSSPDMLFKRAIFGQGPDVYVKVTGKEKLQGPFYQPKVHVIKFNQDSKEIEVPTNLMELDEYSRLSGIIYSGNTASHSWYNDYDLGEDFLFGYHSNALNPIPDDLFKFGRSIRKNPTTGDITDSPQKSDT